MFISVLKETCLPRIIWVSDGGRGVELVADRVVGRGQGAFVGVGAKAVGGLQRITNPPKDGLSLPYF